MNKEGLLEALQKELDEGSAFDVQTFFLGEDNSLADYLLIASGTSTRHVAALAERAAELLKKLGKIKTNIEGLKDANWVLVDGGDFIIHIFRPEVRDYYKIEELFEAKPN